jgi:F-type H+-transporting ATPase subunit epsilon
MKLSILTPSKKILVEQEVSDVFAPGVEGQIEILPEHSNFITELKTGVIRWKTDGAWGAAAISYGWLEIFDNKISVLADVSELATEIDEQRAKSAETKAFKKVTEGGMSDEEFRKYELKLQRAMSRVNALKSVN